MSHHLWRYFIEDDVESFKTLLANATSKHGGAKIATASRGGAIGGSPGGNKTLSTSPVQHRKSLGTPGKARATPQIVLTKADLNLKDHQGLSLLHWIATSRGEQGWEYAQALLEQPLLDLSLQDAESAWTALHRALYFGNVTIARSILSKDVLDVRHHNRAAGSLFKIKDREGNSPFDLYNETIAPRRLVFEDEVHDLQGLVAQDDVSEVDLDLNTETAVSSRSLQGDELFVFGSNKNLNLGVGDEDDRQFPERVVLRRPKNLLQRLRLEHMSTSKSRRNRIEGNEQLSESIDLSGGNPALVDFKPIQIIDIQMSKLHTAILTDDPESNLHVCGFGPGGRLGTGDESTRFSFVCIDGGGLAGHRVESIGLGQDHTLAVSTQGEVFSWGNNRFGQLGYSVASNKDEDPVQLLPRQIFGTVKRERVIGCAASRIHSVVFTMTNLFTFGKNEGQLGLFDSDARSLEIQATPRAVAASLFQYPIEQATAIDKATACMLTNHEVWVFANYGYMRVKFPMDDFANYFLPSTYSTSRFGVDGPNHIVKIGAGGDTISALASQGQVFTVNVSQSIEPAGRASTTNPMKIKNALSEPHRIWSPRKDSMACVDVDVGQDGSIIICTKSGSVWRRIKRAKAKDAKSTGSSGHKAKDFKFSRVPGLTWVSSVRSNAFGSFAAIRNDWDVMRTQLHDIGQTIWQDVFNLFPFRDFRLMQEPGQISADSTNSLDADVAHIRRIVLRDKDIEVKLEGVILGLRQESFDIKLGTTVSDIRVPCHEFLLSGRSSTLLHGLLSLRETYLFDIPDVLTIEYDEEGKPLVLFKGIDILTLFNIVMYLYTDSIVDVWHYTRSAPAMTMRYKQVRVELMKAASALGLKDLERAARLQIEPSKKLARDMEQAYIAPGFFEHSNIEIELNGTSYYGHRALLVQRCPFFQGMFAGLSGGGWVKSRYGETATDLDRVLKVDLTHIDPEIFDLVLRHLYADTGAEMFDETNATSLDAFLDIVMEVMAVANELMLNRLCQVCQQVLGKFVNTRNVCQLLNAVAPCSVTSFKIAALEYICLNLEIMLENHLLDELDEDLMLELDDLVADNQDANHSRTRRGEVAEEGLLERHPDLEERLELARKRKIDSMALRARRLQREEDERLIRDPKSPRIQPRSPRLAGKTSTHDLLFDMDEDGTRSPTLGPSVGHERRTSRLDNMMTPLGSPVDESLWLDSRGKPMATPTKSPAWGSLGDSATPKKPQPTVGTGADQSPSVSASDAASPWGGQSLRAERLDMKQIMNQADEKRHSNISAGLSAQANGNKQPQGSFKMSQKERKRQMQEQQKRQVESEPAPSNGPAARKERPSPWQAVSSGNKVSLKDVLDQPNDKSLAQSTRPAPTPALTLRQTVAGGGANKNHGANQQKAANTPPPQQRSVSSPITSRPIPQRYGSSTKVTTQPRPPSPKPAQTLKAAVPPPSSSLPLVPRSVRHSQTSAEASLQLSMADILAQQQMEKDVIKEATAKRSLQEIQQEQEFMEWWDAEEKATKARMEAESRKSNLTTGNTGRRGGKSSGDSRSRTSKARRGRGAEKGKANDAPNGDKHHSSPSQQQTHPQQQQQAPGHSRAIGRRRRGGAPSAP